MSGAATRSELELQLERLIPAPPERVFRLWTEPELMAKWLAPGSNTIVSCDAEATPGGFWRLVMRHADGEIVTVTGVYRKVEPPLRLVFTWGWLDKRGERGHETVVTVRLEPVPGGTKLVLDQRTFDTKENRDLHHGGWSAVFDNLVGIAGR